MGEKQQEQHPDGGAIYTKSLAEAKKQFVMAASIWIIERSVQLESKV